MVKKIKDTKVIVFMNQMPDWSKLSHDRLLSDVSSGFLQMVFSDKSS